MYNPTDQSIHYTLFLSTFSLLFVYLSTYDCLLFDDERLGERERGGEIGCVRNHAHT